MTKIHISAAFDVSDNQRVQAAIIAGLGEVADAVEAKIKELTGHDVKLDIRAKRANAPKAAGEKATELVVPRVNLAAE